MEDCNLHFTTILGWIWAKGNISASSHHITILSSCPPPPTVKGVRSFIGAYKILSRVIPNCAQVLSPLYQIVAGRTSYEKIIWSDTLLTSFTHAQDGLKHHKSVVLPKPSDQLWIVTDGAVKNHGVGATLYVNKLHLAGFLVQSYGNAKSQGFPVKLRLLVLLPLLNILVHILLNPTIKHVFSLTVSPVCRHLRSYAGREFSSSIRVATFLTIASQYQIY